MRQRLILVEWPEPDPRDARPLGPSEEEELVHTAAAAVAHGLSALGSRGTVQVLGGESPEDLLPELRWCPRCEQYKATRTGTGECPDCGCWTR